MTDRGESNILSLNQAELAIISSSLQCIHGYRLPLLIYFDNEENVKTDDCQSLFPSVIFKQIYGCLFMIEFRNHDIFGMFKLRNVKNVQI